MIHEKTWMDKPEFKKIKNVCSVINTGKRTRRKAKDREKMLTRPMKGYYPK